MSRSTRHEDAPNPAKRWFEWNGEHGRLRYYDKDQKKEIDISVVPPHKAFTFLMLNEVFGITGFHKPSKSGIWSNEVTDTRQFDLVVKSRKEGILAEGRYREIKDRVARVGGHFTSNLYIAFKGEDGQLVIGSLRLRGAALGVWMDFRKANRSTLYDKAVSINGFKEDSSGNITFRVPIFAIKDTTAETDKAALELDKQLRTWLDAYLKRNTRDQVDAANNSGQHVDDESVSYNENERTFDPVNAGPEPPPITDDDIPF